MEYNLPVQAGIHQQVEALQVERRHEAAVEVPVLQCPNVEGVAHATTQRGVGSAADRYIDRVAELAKIVVQQRLVEIGRARAGELRQRNEVERFGPAGAHEVQEDCALADVLRALIDVVGPGGQHGVDAAGGQDRKPCDKGFPPQMTNAHPAHNPPLQYSDHLNIIAARP